jgi:hypothetical protein
LESSLLTPVSSLLTPVQFAANPRQFAANPRQFAANPRRVKTSPTQGAGSPDPLQPCSPPPPEGVRVAAVVTPSGGQVFQPPHTAPPATSPPPPWGLRAGRSCRTVLQFYLPAPAWPRAAPLPHQMGEGSEPAGRLGQYLQLRLTHLLRTPLETDQTRLPGLMLSVMVIA